MGGGGFAAGSDVLLVLVLWGRLAGGGGKSTPTVKQEATLRSCRRGFNCTRTHRNSKVTHTHTRRRTHAHTPWSAAEGNVNFPPFYHHYGGWGEEAEGGGAPKMEGRVEEDQEEAPQEVGGVATLETHPSTDPTPSSPSALKSLHGENSSLHLGCLRGIV